MKATVSEKGQVTIPKKLRERLGIRPGAVLEMVEDHGRIVATKTQPVDPVAAVSGILSPEPTSDEFIDSIRGEVLPGEVDRR
ncbi:MAG: AbrB/MazE/SpoVT family DNA-binding domain-containing protein [Actinomycetota bacterium]